MIRAFAALLVCAAVARADNWPQWRGPNNDGVCNETNLPTEWSADKNIAWKLPLPGMGGSTPAIWGDRIFLTCEEDKYVVLLCVGTDGKQLWKKEIGTSAGRNVRGDEGNNASASPSVDGKFVYAFAGSGELVCFDFDGKEIWKFNCQDRYGKFKNQFGMHSTPALHDGRLHLQLIHSNGAWVIALDAATGKDVWKVARKSDGTDENEHSYASCFVWRKGADAYLVVHGNDYCTAHSLKDGSEIWRLADLNPREKYNRTLRFVASPGVSPDLIVVPSAKSGPVVGVKPDAKGLIRAGSPMEQWRRARDTPDVPCPLVHGGLVYLCRETGNLTCVDAATGAEKYAQQRTHTARFRASPVYADGKIYLVARDGTVCVVKAGPEFKLIATNKIKDETSASIAISNGRIYIHSFKTLYAVGAVGS